MARFSSFDNNGAFTGLSELAAITTDAAGRFTYTFTETYSTPPNVQCQPITPVTGTLGAAATLMCTLQPPTTTSVSGIVTGANGVTIAGIPIVSVSLLSAAVQVQLMILGR